MKLRLTIIFICFILSSFGQEDAEFRKKENLNAIVFAPFNLFDSANPSFQIGWQRELNKKWEGQVEVGLIMRRSLLDMMGEEEDYEDSLKTIHKGFRLRTELKYYLNENRRIRQYVSSELFYLKNNSKTNAEFISNEKPLYRDVFLNKKRKYGANVKYGVKISFKKNFLFEPHIGIGISYREISHENRENKNDTLVNLFWTSNNKIIGNSWVINFPLNIKVGYAF